MGETAAGAAILGGDEIGEDGGYGPARLLRPTAVRPDGYGLIACHPVRSEPSPVDCCRSPDGARLPSMNSPTDDSRAQSSPNARAARSASPQPSAHGASPIAVATRYSVW